MSAEPELWVADMRFSGDKVPLSLRFPRANLFVRTPNASVRGWRFATPSGQIFLLPLEDRERWRIAFEVPAGHGPPPDEHVVRALALLAFVFGIPFRIGVLQAVSAKGPGGLAELGLADHRPQESPSRAEAVPYAETSWLVDFVELAFKYMARFPDAPFLVALHLFNAAHEGFVDTQFLLTFIAAETLATWAIEEKQLMTSGDIRIADKVAWKNWVVANAPVIRTMAVPGKEESLVGRVLSSEINSGSPVQKVFRGEGLGWTPEMEDAEKCRNSVAHQGMLGRHAWRGRNWTRDLERVEFARFMFTALFALLIRYHGPLAGRGIDASKREWWRVSDPAPVDVWHVSRGADA